MTDASMQHGRRLPGRLAALPFALCLAVLPASLSTAEEPLPQALKDGLRLAAQQDAASFRAALRAAIAADPGRKENILAHAIAAYPTRAAELLLASLYDPAIKAPGSADNGLRVVPVNLPPALADQAAVAPPGDTPADAAAAEGVEEKGPWNGTVVMGLTVRTGNTENTGFTGEAEVTYESDGWMHRGKASADYLRSRSETEAQAFEGEYELRHDLGERNFAYGLAHYEDDRFSGYDYEFTASSGLGRHLLKSEDLAWTVTLGPTLRLAQPSDSEEQERALGARLTNQIDWQLSETAKLSNETEALADRERLRVNNDVILKVRIVDQFSGQLSFGFEYRSDTPDEAEHVDTTTKAALVYDF